MREVEVFFIYIFRLPHYYCTAWRQRFARKDRGRCIGPMALREYLLLTLMLRVGFQFSTPLAWRW